MDQANAKPRFGYPQPIQRRALRDVVNPRNLRKRMKLTQRDFAGWFGFPVATLRHWERGNRAPSGTALALLCVIADNPRAVLVAVRKARNHFPGALAAIERLKSYRAPPGFGDPRIPVRRQRR